MTADIRVSVTKDGSHRVMVALMHQNADRLTTVTLTLSAQMLTVAFHVNVGTDSQDQELTEIVLILMSVLIIQISAVLTLDVQIVSPVIVVPVFPVLNWMLTEIALTKMSATETEFSLVTKKTKDSA
jgi:hypothetical protein